MRLSTVFLLVLLVCSAWEPTQAEAQTPPDVVELVGGGMVRGTLVENVPGDHVTIQLVTGEVRTYRASEVVRVGSAATPPLMAPLPPPPVAMAAPGVRLRVIGDTDGLTLHELTGTANVTVWTGNGVGSARVDSFAPLCTAPCEHTLAPGTYTLGVSSGDGNAQRAGHSLWSFDHDTTLELEYESREGIRIGGWVIFGVGTAGFLGLTLLPLATNDYDNLLLYLSIGLGVYVVTLIPFFIMAFLNDHADIHELAEGIRF